jgi:hypothetical protein
LILAIDPGPIESAYVLLGEKLLKPQGFAKISNDKMLDTLYSLSAEMEVWSKANRYDLAVEMVASYGMPVGAEVFETVLWVGRFWEAAHFKSKQLIYRKDVKMNLCGSMKAKDSNIRQALIDRFGPVGTKKNPGWFHGVSGDIWAAIAVGVTYADMYWKIREAKA